MRCVCVCAYIHYSDMWHTKSEWKEHFPNVENENGWKYILRNGDIAIWRDIAKGLGDGFMCDVWVDYKSKK